MKENVRCSRTYTSLTAKAFETPTIEDMASEPEKSPRYGIGGLGTGALQATCPSNDERFEAMPEKMFFGDLAKPVARSIYVSSLFLCISKAS